jgi:hypothetical protein
MTGNIAKKHLDQNFDAMTSEQRAKAQEMIRKGDEARETRLNKERES